MVIAAVIACLGAKDEFARLGQHWQNVSGEN